MSNEEVIQGNKIIAEFIGWSQADYMPVSEYLKPPKDFVITHNQKDFEWSAYKIDALQYHTSWDWLMPVVEKIRQMAGDPKECFMGTTLDRHINFEAVLSLMISSSIEEVYKAVITFINWYNLQLQTAPKSPLKNKKP